MLIPEENVKDLQDIPENAKNNLEIVPVKWIDQVLELALEAMPKALPDEEVAADPAGGQEGRAGAGIGGRRAAALREGDFVMSRVGAATGLLEAKISSYNVRLGSSLLK